MTGLWFYFSFADPSRPKGTQFLGGCYVQAPDETKGLPEKEMLWETLRRSHALGINPGGEVRTLGPITSGYIEENVVPADRERLLTREELEWTTEPSDTPYPKGG